MNGKIFIDYRREDDPAYAGRIHDWLVERFGKDSMFLDVDAIAPGTDFVDELNKQVSGTDVFLAIIGTRWLTATYQDGARRFDDSNDFIRIAPLLSGQGQCNSPASKLRDHSTICDSVRPAF